MKEAEGFPSSDSPTARVPGATADPKNPGGLKERVRQVHLKNGKTYVIVEVGDEVKHVFDHRTVEFEIKAGMEEMDGFLKGLSPQALQGLLVYLSGAVNDAGQSLKALEEQLQALCGEDNYDYFGLDGENCSDKDLEKAYRRASRDLHPDKGGDEDKFAEMRKKYEQLKALREEEKQGSNGGGSIKWDPHDIDSMYKAHRELREQLIWVNRKTIDGEKRLHERRMRSGRNYFLMNQ